MMSKEEVLNYKLALSKDFISYLCTVLTMRVNKEDSSKILGEALNIWATKVSRLIKNLQLDTVKKTASPLLEMKEYGDDVLSIMVDIAFIDQTSIREEFVNEMLDFLQTSVIENKD